MRALVVGANHRTAPLSLRDTLFVDDLAQPDFLNDLNLPQAVALSTCDRVEVWTFCRDPESVQSHIVETMARRGGLPPSRSVDRSIPSPAGTRCVIASPLRPRSTVW